MVLVFDWIIWGKQIYITVQKIAVGKSFERRLQLFYQKCSKTGNIVTCEKLLQFKTTF